MPKSSHTARPAAVAIAPEIAPRPAEPGWAKPLRTATAAVEEAVQRHRHALDRLPVVRQEVDEASRSLAREEAAEPLQYAGCATDGAIAARKRLEGAEAEHAKARRIVAALAEAVAEKRGALAPIAQAALPKMAAWGDAQMQALDARFHAAVEAAAAVVAEAMAFADGAGIAHLLPVLDRMRLPGSLMRSDTMLSIGAAQGRLPPQSTQASDQAATLWALLTAARVAAEPATASTATREAA